jgi:hypothetical protein
MSRPVVTVSPLPAHFLLRSSIEQAVIVSVAGLFALPGLLLLVAHVWTLGISFGALPGAILALVLGSIGLKLGTGVANVIALLRIRREQKMGGDQ